MRPPVVEPGWHEVVSSTETRIHPRRRPSQGQAGVAQALFARQMHEEKLTNGNLRLWHAKKSEAPPARMTAKLQFASGAAAFSGAGSWTGGGSLVILTQ